MRACRQGGVAGSLLEGGAEELHRLVGAPAQVVVVGTRGQTFRAEPVEEPEEAIEDRERVRRAAGDVEVHGHYRVRAVVGLIVPNVRAARDGARADGNHDLWGGDGVVGL